MSGDNGSPPLLMQRTVASKYLGISPSYFWKLEKTGHIPPGVRLPGTTRGQWWHRDQVDAIAESLTKKPATAGGSTNPT